MIAVTAVTTNWAEEQAAMWGCPGSPSHCSQPLAWNDVTEQVAAAPAWGLRSEVPAVASDPGPPP